MRAYHFVNAKFGLEDLKKRRLKIATIRELNDPFELFGMDMSNDSIRRAFKVMKEELASERGLLCFSKTWSNPVLWSHYADKHRGICLGFDVTAEKIGEVSYSAKRLVADMDKLKYARQFDEKTLIKIFFTKYSHWKYENEVRCFVTLEERDAEKNLYFVDFSDELKLREVIVGANSTITRLDIQQALDNLQSSVTAFKARLAFKTFRVVRQQNETMWI